MVFGGSACRTAHDPREQAAELLKMKIKFIFLDRQRAQMTSMNSGGSVNEAS